MVDTRGNQSQEAENIARYGKGTIYRDRALLRKGFWDDHAHELTLYAEGQLEDIMRPVGSYGYAKKKGKE